MHGDPTPPLSSPFSDLHDNGDLSEMLSEQRILLPGAQMLTTFLLILPLNGGFRQIAQAEKKSYSWQRSYLQCAVSSSDSRQAKMRAAMQDQFSTGCEP